MTLNPGILAAIFIGLTMVGGAFLLADDGPETTNVTYTDPSKPSYRSFIKVTDSDGNNLPDWQDSLDLPTINLNNDKATSTKTAAIAVELASHSLAGTSTPDSLDLTTQLKEVNNDTPYTREDILIGSDDSKTAWRTYGNAVARISFEQAPPAGTPDEMTVLNSALLNENPTLLKQLDPTIESYEAMIDAMLKTTAPPSLVKEHLSLLNVYQAILIDLRAFRLVFEDAFPAMSRFSRYQADGYALYTGISNLYLKLHQNGIQWSEADEASRLIKVESTE